jgi:hypothetical protein
MSMLLLSLSVFQFSLVAGYAVKKNKLIYATPSLVWFALMTLPFIYQFQFFPTGPRVAQSIGMVTISTAIAAGDIFSIVRKSSERVTENTNLILIHSKLIYFFTSLIIFVPAVHYWLAGTIPIVDQYFRGASSSEISQDRENFVKLLDVPYLLKVLFNWVSVIFGPICVLWFYFLKRRLLAVLLLLWVIIYSFSSSADGPIVIICWRRNKPWFSCLCRHFLLIRSLARLRHRY